MHFRKSPSQQLAVGLLTSISTKKSPNVKSMASAVRTSLPSNGRPGNSRQRQIRFQARLRYLGIDLRNVDVNSQLSGRGNMKQFPGRTATASRIDQLVLHPCSGP